MITRFEWTNARSIDDAIAAAQRQKPWSKPAASTSWIA